MLMSLALLRSILLVLMVSLLATSPVATTPGWDLWSRLRIIGDLDEECDCDSYWWCNGCVAVESIETCAPLQECGRLDFGIGPSEGCDDFRPFECQDMQLYRWGGPYGYESGDTVCVVGRLIL
jgi:hypothetical protein